MAENSPKGRPVCYRHLVKQESKQEDKPVVSFRDIKTVAVMGGVEQAHLSGSGFWLKASWRAFWARLGIGSRSHGHSPNADAIANTARVWRGAVEGWRKGEVRSTFRYLDTLKSAVDRSGLNNAEHLLAQLLLKEAWRTVREELVGRMGAIDGWLQEAEPRTTPEAFYWAVTLATGPAGEFEPQSVGRAHAELAKAERTLDNAKSAAKLLALHVGELAWLAGRVRFLGAWFSPVPSKRDLDKMIRRTERCRARLDALKDKLPPASTR